MSHPPIDTKRWARLMGRDLGLSKLQPLQPVRIRKDGTLKITRRSLQALEISSGDRLRVQLRDARCLLTKARRGGVRAGEGRLPVPHRVCCALFVDGVEGGRRPMPAVLVGGDGEARIVPIHVQEHAPDLLGPRFVDEFRGDGVVRHAIPGPCRDDWTREALGELEELLCPKPFKVDPVRSLAQGDDWVAWMTRNRIVRQPAAGDDRLRNALIRKVLRDQQADGSWGAVPATAYAMLRLLDLGKRPSGKPMQRAAQWLLDLPEPPPRAGMWMLTQEYLDEWLSKRRPRERRDFGPGETQRTGPGRDSFYAWEYPEHEQDQFRSQGVQQAIPVCARHHPPACEPRITHVSAVVAEALLRCGFHHHPRLRRYLNTVFHVGGEWGYWCGCGALGLSDADIRPCGDTPDFDLRRVAEDGRRDLAPWRWIAHARQAALLANDPDLPRRGSRGTHVDPFFWRHIPGKRGSFALVGMGWQNGDCWLKTNRALARHPACPGSLTEHNALYQASRYQTSLGEWAQAFPAGMLALLSLYRSPVAQSLVIKTVPWLRAHQARDGLWHHEELHRIPWGRLADPPGPRLATYHIIAALNTFGLLGRLRP